MYNHIRFGAAPLELMENAAIEFYVFYARLLLSMSFHVKQKAKRMYT